MKKLMTVMAAAATALFAIGAANGEKGGADIEGEAFVAGNPLNLDANDNGTEDTTDGNLFWSMAETSDDIGVTISNYVGETSASTPIETRPDLFASAGNTKYLALDTSSPLVRNMVGKNTEGSKAVDIEDGIYLDTLVKFTAADDVFGDDALATGDKIAISYVEQSDEVADPITNFVIRAGYIKGAQQIVATNYVAMLPDDMTFDKEAWHRLTVRTLPSINNANHVGFVVYVDETALVYAEENVKIGDGEFATTTVADALKDSVFPSAVAVGDDKTTITAASFSGTGAIDDVVFTKDTPNFISAGEKVVAKFEADTNAVASITINYVTGPENSVVVDMDTLKAELDAATAEFTVTPVINESAGYQLVSIAYGATTNSVIPFAISNFKSGDTITIKTARNNFNVFANGGIISGTYETLSQALAANGVEKIQLAYDYDVTAAEIAAAENEIYTIESGIILDLNGKTLNGGTGNGCELFYVSQGGSLTVIDSSADNTGKIVYGGPSVFGSEASLSVGAVEGDNGVKIDGVLFTPKAEGLVVNAKVLASANTAEDAFVWADFVAEGSTLQTAPADGYWVVTPSGEEPGEDTEIAVPTAASNLVYDGTEQIGVAAGTGYTLTGDFKATNAGDYTATATLAEGYVWEGGSKDATNITWSIAKAQVTATVSLTVTSATYDSTKTSVTDYTTPSVSFGLGAPALVENTDYTVAWSATEVTGAGTFTYTVSPVADSNYTFTQASATLTITAGGEYPSYIPAADDAAKAKYDTWKETYGADTASAYEAAFLLNIDPEAVDQTLEPESITIENGKVVITANQDLENVNGKVYIKTAGTLAGLADAQWAVATLDKDGAIEMTPNGTATAAFFKIKVDF